MRDTMGSRQYDSHRRYRHLAQGKVEEQNAGLERENEVVKADEVLAKLKQKYEPTPTSIERGMVAYKGGAEQPFGLRG